MELGGALARICINAGSALKGLKVTMASIRPWWNQPSHPLVLKVIHAPGAFTTMSRSQMTLPPGALVARLHSPPLSYAEKAYSSVQVSRTEHIELNCDFLYVNHSCEPTLEFNVLSSESIPGASANEGTTGHASLPIIEVRVAARKDANGEVVGLKSGDEMTFFYPSTEWEMAQPFDCFCGAKTCRKRISGAKDMEKEHLQGLFINSHIRDLLDEQERAVLHGGTFSPSELNKMSNGIPPEPSISDCIHVDASKQRHKASARALAGEMGGDTSPEATAT